MTLLHCVGGRRPRIATSTRRIERCFPALWPCRHKLGANETQDKLIRRGSIEIFESFEQCRISPFFFCLGLEAYVGLQNIASLLDEKLRQLVTSFGHRLAG